MNKKFGIFIALIFLGLNFKVLRQIFNNSSKYKNIENEIKITEEKIKKIDEQIYKYDEFIKKLDENFEQEKIARNNLKMVKENEIIYRLIEKNNREEQ